MRILVIELTDRSRSPVLAEEHCPNLTSDDKSKQAESGPQPVT